MATTYMIPLTPAAQTFSVTLGGRPLVMTLQFMEAGDAGWILDIADAAGNSIIAGIPLVTGADLLGQYAYLGLGGSLAVMTDGDPAAVPTYANLGTTANLYFVVS